MGVRVGGLVGREADMVGVLLGPLGVRLSVWLGVGVMWIEGVTVEL